MAYQTIEVKKLTPVIGAEIHGVDLAQPLGNQQFQEIHDALMENLVIFFRDQKISIAQHKDFGRKFGRLHVHPNAKHMVEGEAEFNRPKARRQMPAELGDHCQQLLANLLRKLRQLTNRKPFQTLRAINGIKQTHQKDCVMLKV